jgi:hypothetical protein
MNGRNVRAFSGYEFQAFIDSSCRKDIALMAPWYRFVNRFGRFTKNTGKTPNPPV